MTNSSDESNKKTSDKRNTMNTMAKFKKTGYDYYKILRVDNKADLNEIKKQYRKMVAKYHPDKQRGLSDDKKKEYAEYYKLVQLAGDVLTDPSKRKIYDIEQRAAKNSDFESQKHSFDEFIKLQDADNTEENRNKALLDFKRENEKRNKLRNYDPTAQAKLDKKTLDKNLQDLQASRDAELIEISHKNIFEGRNFNPSEFNALFEKKKYLDEKKEKKLRKLKEGTGQMTLYNDSFTAFNDTGVGAFISVNDDYGELFGNDDFRENSLYTRNKDYSAELDELSPCSDDSFEYTDNFNNYKNNKLTDDEMKKKLAERDLETGNFDEMKYGDFKSALHDPFGVSKDFGVLLEGKLTGQPDPREITYDQVSTYNKLIGYDDHRDANSSDEDEDFDF